MPGNEGQDEHNGDDDAVDFGATFEEFASSLSPAPDDAAATQAQLDPDDNEEDGDMVPPPAADAGGTNTQAAPSGPAGEPSNDLWANASAEQKAELDRLKHQLASTTGRLSASDRQLAEFRTRTASDTARQDGGDRDNGGRAADKPASIRDNPKVKTLLEDYADVAGPLVDIIEEQQKLIDRVTAPVDAITQDRNQAILAEQFAVVTTAHPDVGKVVTDPRYVDWLASQPRAVRDAYERNQAQVVDGQEAAWVIGLFKREMGIETATPSPTPTPTPTPSPSGSAADVKRQRQLDANRDGGRSRGVAANLEADTDDLDAQFRHFSGKIERKRQAAGLTS